MSDPQANANPESASVEDKPSILRISGTKESLFQQNTIKVGLDLSCVSRGTGSFASELLESIEKQHDEPPPPSPQLTAQLTEESKNVNLPIEGRKCGPAAGFFKKFDISHVSTQPAKFPSSRFVSPSSPGSERRACVQRKGSLSPGPVSTRHRPSKEPQSRYQPYSAVERQDKKRLRTLSLPNELAFGATYSEVGFEPTKRYPDVKKLEFPHTDSKLLASIFLSHPKYSKTIAGLHNKFGIHVNVQMDGSVLTVHLEGHSRGISKAESELRELVKQVQDSITSEVVAPLVPCSFFPMLVVSQPMLSIFEEIEQENRVNILVCQANDSPLPLNSEKITQPFSLPEAIPKVADFKHLVNPFKPVDMKYKWQVEDDSGEFQLVPNEVQNLLNQCYFSGLPQFSYEGKHYRLDLVEEKLHEMDTGVVRKFLKESLPPVWSYCLSQELGFIEFEPDDSKVLENLMLYGGSGVKILHIKKGTVDFQNMALVNLSSELIAPLIDIKRSPCMSSDLPTYGIRLIIKGLEDDIRVATFSLREKLEKIELTEKKLCLPAVSLQQQHMIRAHVVNSARQYFVELSAADEDSGQVIISIKGERKYVQSVHLQLEKDAIELQQHLLSQDRQRVLSHQCFANALSRKGFPTEWKPQEKDVELQSVTVDSIEGEGVLNLMRYTMPQVNLVKVERIQNKPLWNKYALEMDQMERRNGAFGINELLLFHGTRRTHPKEIAESPKGIDFRYSDRDRKLLWGQGSYFAVNASYSDNYSHRVVGDKLMLLVRVLTGRSYSYGTRTDPKLTKPPPLSQGSHVLHDTVKGFTNGSEVYVVYDHDKAYPAYLITYR